MSSAVVPAAHQASPPLAAGRTTYATLVARAARRMARAQALASQDRAPAPGDSEARDWASRDGVPADATPGYSAPTAASSRPDQREDPAQRTAEQSAVDAHRDLAAALAHLGRTLAGPNRGHRAVPVGPACGSGSGRGPAAGAAAAAVRSRGPRPSRALLTGLASYGHPRDWATPRPDVGAAGDLAAAALLIRAAADLWATHHTAQGAPRSPEAAKMRHPSTLGAATRQWQDLIRLAAAAGAALTTDSTAHCPAGSPGPAFPAVPAPRSGAARATQLAEALEVSVARPGVRRAHGPLTELADRVDRLRHLAWTAAGESSPSRAPGAPAIVLANLAAIGVALNDATALAHRAAAATNRQPAKSAHLAAAEHARAAHLRWRDAADLLRCLRTPHPQTHPVQVERLDIHALLRQLPTPACGEAASETAWALTGIAEAYGKVAEHNAAGLESAHDAGDLMLLGRAIPREALPRRPDLLAARLNDCVIHAPALVVDRLLDLYRQIAAADGRSVPELAPPAA